MVTPTPIHTLCSWANAMAVVAVEQLLGIDCDAEAEKLRR